MLHIDIICIGKIKESFFRDAIQEYLKRISKYCVLNIIELPDEKIPLNLNEKTMELIKEKESNRILSHIKKGSYTICLDLNGKNLNSIEFAQTINSLSIERQAHISFLIGGSLGMSNELLNYADKKISFSNLTFPHQLIRIFLLEQLFRSFKIINGETYHR